MGATSIEWTDATWNPLRGCDKVSPGCKHCYAETFAERFRGKAGHPFEHGFDLRLVPEKLADPLRWTRPRRVFVNSMSDLFHEDVPDEYIAAVFGVMAAASKHTFQVLTKRAERMERWFKWLTERQRTRRFGNQNLGPLAEEAIRLGIPEDAWIGATAPARSLGDSACFPWPLPNVWLGVSVEDQERADERIPHLLRVPAAVRFLSCEPLLGPVDLRPWIEWPDCACDGEYAPCDVCDDNGPRTDLGWVIVGGESGHHARPMDLAWARSLVRQCRDTEVAVFVKQLGRDPFDSTDNPRGQPSWSWPVKNKKGGDMAEWPEDLRVREFPEGDND